MRGSTGAELPIFQWFGVLDLARSCAIKVAMKARLGMMA
jgi:hypothetical protein